MTISINMCNLNLGDPLPSLPKPRNQHSVIYFHPIEFVPLPHISYLFRDKVALQSEYPHYPARRDKVVV
jgi:hypothetical protein